MASVSTRSMGHSTAMALMGPTSPGTKIRRQSTAQVIASQAPLSQLTRPMRELLWHTPLVMTGRKAVKALNKPASTSCT